MKFPIAILFSTFAVAASQKWNYKQHASDYRKDQFVDKTSTLEGVKQHHTRRMERLSEMIEDRRQQLADHDSGHRVLSDEHLEKATRQHTMFQRKLLDLQSRTDEDHREILDELESYRNMHRVDDFDL
eukprot:Nitzschia sp. Nitz4//scaffold81_size91200//55234//55773//NITZ4_004989-RA/size91200-processed-gene-0.128-mRNA-1//-1//CDS//3329558719//8723//frame0